MIDNDLYAYVLRLLDSFSPQQLADVEEHFRAKRRPAFPPSPTMRGTATPIGSALDAGFPVRTGTASTPGADSAFSAFSNATKFPYTEMFPLF